jgi:hypothetical protein
VVCQPELGKGIVMSLRAVLFGVSLERVSSRVARGVSQRWNGRRLPALAALALSLYGCSGEPWSNEPPIDESPVSVPSRQSAVGTLDGDDDQDMRALAADYMYEELDPSNPTAVIDSIRALGPAQARAFHAALAELNGLSGTARALFDASFEVASEQGISFMDLDDELVAEAARRAVPGMELPARPLRSMSREPRILLPAQADAAVEKETCIPLIEEACVVDPNFDDGYAMVGASCLDGCVNATSVDRQSNDVCELGGCDYRIQFPAPALTLMDVRNAAGLCAVGLFDQIGAYSTPTTTFAQLGFVRIAAQCGISGAAVGAQLFRATN